jgi:hypothetical protein
MLFEFWVFGLNSKGNTLEFKFENFDLANFSKACLAQLACWPTRLG